MPTRAFKPVAIAAAIASTGVLLSLSIPALGQDPTTPTQSVATIDWPAAQVDAKSAGLSAGRLRLRNEDLDLVGLPLLVPRQAIGQLKVSARKNLYTAKFRQGTTTVMITGTSIVFTPPPGAPTPDFDGKDMRIERSEIGVEVAFSRYGAAYRITIACDQPETDPRCVNDDYANQVYGSLAAVLSTSQGSPQ
jgi:hypothetical protein